MIRRYLSKRALFIAVPVALVGFALVATVAIALWQNVAPISGFVHTGTINAGLTSAFTDDDDHVNDPAGGRDVNDTGLCPDVGGVAPAGATTTSCDPAASGPDLIGHTVDAATGAATSVYKARYTQDVARCDASIVPAPATSLVPSGNTGQIVKTNAYPGYFCTAWFLIQNSGTVPVVVSDVQICDASGCHSVAFPLTHYQFDLNGDGVLDVDIDITEITPCQPILPRQSAYMDVDQEVLDGVPQGATLSETVKVVLSPWTKPGPYCRQPPTTGGAVPYMTPAASPTPQVGR
jgi:hypothetical protein